jgi:drug/metabolite transporter (DMT)-like permease
VQNEKPLLIVWGTLLLLAFVWGSSFILMKVAMFDGGGREVYSAIDVAALRVCIAGLVILPFALVKLKSIPRDKFKWILGIGTFGNLFPAYLFTSAQTEIPSAIAGMLNALTPLFTMIVAAIVFHTIISKRQIGGLVVGFVGAIILIASGGEFSGEIEWWACGKVALATLFYGFSVNILRNKLLGVGSTAIAAIALAMVMPVAIMVLMTSNVAEVLIENPHGMTGMMAVGVLGVLGTAGALVLFNGLIKWTDALTASSVTYIIPVFAALWGWLDGEVLTVQHLIGGGIILAGVALINRSRVEKS